MQRNVRISAADLQKVVKAQLALRAFNKILRSQPTGPESNPSVKIDMNNDGSESSSTLVTDEQCMPLQVLDSEVENNDDSECYKCKLLWCSIFLAQRSNDPVTEKRLIRLLEEHEGYESRTESLIEAMSDDGNYEFGNKIGNIYAKNDVSICALNPYFTRVHNVYGEPISDIIQPLIDSVKEKRE